MSSKKVTEKNRIDKISFSLSSLILVLESNKYPLVITLGFLLLLSYVTFFHHHYLINHDGIFYLRAGEQILEGNGVNVKVSNAPVGGPILYAFLDQFLNNGFITLKLISLFSGTAIVFFSYYIVRNVSNSKIATISQLFFAFGPALQSRAIFSTNELLPLLLIIISLYFITKREFRLSDIILSGALLGISAMIRVQSVPVLLAILIFLLIRNRRIRTNLAYCLLTVTIFIIAFSPVMIYNYYTHEVLIDTDAGYYVLTNWRYLPAEWQYKIEQSVVTNTHVSIFIDFDVFLKNYFYNLFYHNPNLLFNFHFNNAISIIPIIPFLGIIPVLGGVIYILNINLNKYNLSLLLGSASVTAFLVFLLGDIHLYFFAIIIIPLLVIGIQNIRNVEKDLLPLLILPVVFFLTISIAPLDRADHLLPMWISITTFSAIFFVEGIPKIISRTNPRREFHHVSKTTLTVLLISLVLIANLGYSYKLFQIYLYNDTYSDIQSEFAKIFRKKAVSQQAGIEYKQIGEFLSKQDGIENSYVMANHLAYSYYAKSKFLYSTFQEGVKNDPLESFITRENWSAFDIYNSNITSYPSDRHGVYRPIPDYLVYKPLDPEVINPLRINSTQTKDLEVLSNPNDPRIPTIFKPIYQHETGIVVYKIDYKK